MPASPLSMVAALPSRSCLVRQRVQYPGVSNALGGAADRAPRRTVLFYATDDDQAAGAIERVIPLVWFRSRPARQGRRPAELHDGDLHRWAGLNGEVLDRALAAVTGS